MLVGYVIKLLPIMILYIHMWRIKKRRDQVQAIDDSGARDEKERVGRQGTEGCKHDMTVLDNKYIRYVL